jgi:hypothetical protein
MSKHTPDTAQANAGLVTGREASRRDHLPYDVRHIDDVECILRLEPGANHPEHYHGFAQVWYILKGEFTIDGKLCTPGTMLFHPDPHFEGDFRTETGGEILIVQYPGPTTGERPIFAGRFDMAERKTIADERVDL